MGQILAGLKPDLSEIPTTRRLMALADRYRPGLDVHILMSFLYHGASFWGFSPGIIWVNTSDMAGGKGVIQDATAGLFASQDDPITMDRHTMAWIQDRFKEHKRPEIVTQDANMWVDNSGQIQDWLKPVGKLCWDGTILEGTAWSKGHEGIRVERCVVMLGATHEAMWRIRRQNNGSRRYIWYGMAKDRAKVSSILYDHAELERQEEMAVDDSVPDIQPLRDELKLVADLADEIPMEDRRFPLEVSIPIRQAFKEIDRGQNTMKRGLRYFANALRFHAAINGRSVVTDSDVAVMDLFTPFTMVGQMDSYHGNLMQAWCGLTEPWVEAVADEMGAGEEWVFGLADRSNLLHLTRDDKMIRPNDDFMVVWRARQAFKRSL